MGGIALLFLLGGVLEATAAALCKIVTLVLAVFPLAYLLSQGFPEDAAATGLGWARLPLLGVRRPPGHLNTTAPEGKRAVF
jgi:hypothetical protein